MKKLFLLSYLMLASSLSAQVYMATQTASVTTGSGTNQVLLLIPAGQYVVTGLTVQNTGTNQLYSVKFLDTLNTTGTITLTNVPTVAQYTTNFTIVQTNVDNTLQTNTFTGLYTSITKSTNTIDKPVIYQLNNFPTNSIVSETDMSYKTLKGIGVSVTGTNTSATISVSYRLVN